MRNSSTSNRLVIFGASVRAACQSAARAGFQVLGADLFADTDSRAAGNIHVVTDYPHEFEQLGRDLPDAPWMYTGGLENYPMLVERISATRRLLGNRASVLREVRDPFVLTSAFRSHAIPAIETSGQVPCDDENGSWLRKPTQSCGGLGIERVVSESPAKASRKHYYQRYVQGSPCSALFLGCQGRSHLVGSCRQIPSSSDLSAHEFRFRGVYGPFPRDDDIDNQWLRIGECLCQRFALSGLYGVDAVLTHGRLWPVEVNPRYPSSVEIYERALGVNLIGFHVRACQGRLPASMELPAPCNAYGKCVLYARHDFVVTSAIATAIEQANAGRAQPCVSDIPDRGASIREGQPVMTVFADAKRADHLPAVLDQLADHWNQRFRQQASDRSPASHSK